MAERYIDDDLLAFLRLHQPRPSRRETVLVGIIGAASTIFIAAQCLSVAAQIAAWI